MTTRKQQLSLRRKRRNEERQTRNRSARKATVSQRAQNVRHQTELQFLLSRGVRGITPRQYEAGDRLYRDWRASGSEPQLVPRYDREVGLPPSASLDAQVDARRRYDLGMRKCGTRLHRAVIAHVCLLDQRLAAWELPAASGLELLRAALDALADWYETRHQDRERWYDLQVA